MSWILGGVISAIAILLSPVTESSEQRELGRALVAAASAMDSRTAGGRTTALTLELQRGEGLPRNVAHLKADLVLAPPERLSVSTTVDKFPIQLARAGQEIWIWQPGKSFGVVAEPGVARFQSAPDASRDQSHLEPLRLPVHPRLLSFAPRLLEVSSAGEEIVDGVLCRVLKAKPRPMATGWLKLPPVSLTLWIRTTDHWPARIQYADGKSIDALLAVSNLRTNASVPEAHWKIPAPEGSIVDHVALSHLTRFFRAAYSLARIDVRPLPPAKGNRQVVATHGKGRLELQDGARVLFLRGSPEEMGEQHGTLLKPEVRLLVDRVLYGVGVGSSFAKGRWFFGEIEQCEARLHPFIDPRYLREMDAMAAAAGIEKEEMRLANFFPELFHCSGFALMGKASGDGHIYHGRILDYLRGVGLEANALVTVNQPDDGHAWVNVGYAGFTGSVTAMNDQRISIGEMGGRGEGSWNGKPMAQLVREVMEKAGTLDEAVEIMRRGPRTCEYFYVIADGKSHTAVGIAATPEQFEVLKPGEAHPRLPSPVEDAVLLSAGDRYTELVRRVQASFGHFDAGSARELMTRPVCMNSNIHSVLFEPDTLDFWVANADSRNVASANRYTHYNLAELLQSAPSAR